MQKFAIFQGAMTPNQNNVVVEVVDEVVTIDGTDYPLTERYHASLIATMKRCPDGTQSGDEYDIITDTYARPTIQAMDGDTGNGEPPPR